MATNEDSRKVGDSSDSKQIRLRRLARGGHLAAAARVNEHNAYNHNYARGVREKTAHGDEESMELVEPTNESRARYHTTEKAGLVVPKNVTAAPPTEKEERSDQVAFKPVTMSEEELQPRFGPGVNLAFPIRADGSSVPTQEAYESSDEEELPQEAASQTSAQHDKGE